MIYLWYSLCNERKTEEFFLWKTFKLINPPFTNPERLSIESGLKKSLSSIEDTSFLQCYIEITLISKLICPYLKGTRKYELLILGYWKLSEVE